MNLGTHWKTSTHLQNYDSHEETRITWKHGTHLEDEVPHENQGPIAKTGPSNPDPFEEPGHI